MNESLKKCYAEVADFFDKYIVEHGVTQDIHSSKEIKSMLSENGIVLDTLFQVSDMCYNHTTKPFGNVNKSEAFENQKHIFEYIGWDKYRILGTNYLYTGDIIRISKKLKIELVIGEWFNGEIIKWDENKFLDIEEYQDETDYLINSFDEIKNMDIEGKDKIILAKARINQSFFRERLIRRYNHCCLCGVKNSDLLKASHIKPWAECNSMEKVDVNNGLLLCPNHDGLFDKGYISFDDNGKILISQFLLKNEQIFMNIQEDMKIELCEENRIYLKYHRENCFKR